VTYFFLAFAALLQAVAVAYGLVLLGRRQGATGGWLFLLGAMISMLAWRVFVLLGVEAPPYFNPTIAIWGSTCMVAAMYCFGREVALRRRVESERDALLSSERAARQEAERASRLKDDFLATASHELRTPLSVILTWCSILRTGSAGKQQADKAIEIIERNARIQARLVDDLLDMTRMQAGNLHLDLRQVPLDVPVRAALMSVVPAAEAKGIQIDLQCATPAPGVMGDPGRLQQIAGNLLTNAIKFTGRGGHIRVRIDSAGGRARLEVSDDGEGIEAEVLPRLFGRFQQADSSTTRRHGGLGLGLSIVAHLARLHGGTAHAASPGVGQGSTFVVDLPLSQEAANESSVGSAEQPPALSLAGLRILLVDDEPDVREATSTLLRQLGAEVSTLGSAADILPQMERYRPHILILDIGMPGEDGYSLMQRIRREAGKPGRLLPAISLTAHAREEDRARALGSGFQDHLPKPIDVWRLASTVRRLTAAETRTETSGA
jgi:signal transduction histidine kinase/ActR/RegA family two-component response regulator